MKKESPQLPAYSLRLDPEIRATLETLAKSNGRSLNAEIAARLDASLHGSAPGHTVDGMGDEDRRIYPVVRTFGFPEKLYEKLRRTAANARMTENSLLVARLETTYYSAHDAIKQEDDGARSTARARSLVRLLSKQIAKHEELRAALVEAEAHAAEEYAEFLAALTPEERQQRDDEILREFDTILDVDTGSKP